jgi:polar amino acid transport system permease protein
VATPTTQTTAPKKKMTRRQRAQYFRWAQYAIGIAILVAIAFLADWAQFAKSFLNIDVALKMFPEVITTGLKNTLIYTVLAFLFGLVFGVIIALMRLSDVRVYRVLGSAYVELFRGLPSLLVLFLVALGIPRAFPGFQFPGGFYGQVTVGLGLTAAAYMAETIRAGIQAVPKGQVEAARTLGFSPARTLRVIVLPQAFRIVIPPLTNEIILLVKDSSLVYVLGVTLSQYELTKFSQSKVVEYASSTPLVVGGLCYLVITLPLSQLVRRLEIRHAKAR